ncbi:hypothetical protein LCER1_G006668 [Lachnellula cervina]|uniref:Uncharacterized protein n=1 Tax=Lachnellula cervina TaxID=1316786 RepID=A0A7D8YPL8_9HELO|nr:hypothetical protein LCER1_G006668 [Lachnellula cervina]
MPAESGSPPSKREIFVILSIAIAAVIYLQEWATRWIGGLYYYNAEYIKAALGDDFLEEACASVLLVRDPWNTLVTRDWFKMQRCKGNRDGFNRQGELVQVFWDGFLYYCSTLSILGPPVIQRLLLHLQNPPQAFILQTFWISVIVGAIPLYIFCSSETFYIFSFGIFIIVALASDAVHKPDLSNAMHRQSPPAWTWSNLLQPVTIVWSGVSDIGNFSRKLVATLSLSYLNECHHVDTCTCGRLSNAPVQPADYTELLKTQQQTVRDLEAERRLACFRQDEIIALREAIYAAEERESLWRNNGRTSGTDWDLWDKSDYSPQSPQFDQWQGSLGAQSLQADRTIALLQKDNTDLSDQMRLQEKSFQSRIKALQSQLAYAQRDGNSTQAQEELNALIAKNRLQQKQIMTLGTDLMHNIQNLEYERNSHSLKCKDEAGCQTRIRELESQREVLFQQHEANDAMVQQAAIEFGKSPEEARHYTLRTYLQEITEAMVRQIAEGKLINTDDKPIFKSIIDGMDQQRIKEITEYKNRLEIEVQRLGGDVKTMRLGLHPQRPPPHRDLTYENNARTVYDFYNALFMKVSHLTSIIENSGRNVPIWAPENPRSDVYNSPLYLVHVWTDPRAVQLVKNPRYEDNELLLQSLLRSEICRLVNRGMELKTYIERNFSGEDSDSFFNNKVAEPVKEAGVLFKNALFHILDDVRPLEKRDASIEDASLAARAERRYKIWRAMQTAISALTHAMGTFNCSAPPWTNDPLQPAPNLIFRKSFEALATNLMKFEINTLEHRISTLLAYITSERLPGSVHGASRMQGPPGYQADFDALKAAVTFGLLCKDHWADEVITDPEFVKPLRLPLDHPPLIHAVLRKSGDVMVPKQNPFPWKMVQDGKLLPVSEASGEWEAFQLPAGAGKNDKGFKKTGNLETEKKWYDETYDRVLQLSNWISKSGKQGAFALPIMGMKGVSKEWKPDFLRAKRGELARWEKELSDWMLHNDVKIPQLPNRGGKMWP